MAKPDPNVSFLSCFLKSWFVMCSTSQKQGRKISSDGCGKLGQGSWPHGFCLSCNSKVSHVAQTGLKATLSPVCPMFLSSCLKRPSVLGTEVGRRCRIRRDNRFEPVKLASRLQFICL